MTMKVYVEKKSLKQTTFIKYTMFTLIAIILIQGRNQNIFTDPDTTLEFKLESIDAINEPKDSMKIF